MGDVEIRGLVKEFAGGVRALDALDLRIEEGEFFALLGPSGCGKTTLLRTIAGLEAPSDGSVWIAGRDVTRISPGGRNVAMVFQDYALYPHMTVVDNIAYPLKVRKVGRAQREGTAREVATSLQLDEGSLRRRPAQLSGGQQQRVALARAMAVHPAVFLFDEPLSNLDARLRLEARTFLKRLQRELGITTVYVTHDQGEALALADRMAVMELGRIRQVGSPADFFQRPANLFVAAFIGSTPMNLLDGRVQDGSVHIGRHRLPIPESAGAGVAAGEEIVFGARPEYVGVTDQHADDSIDGRVAVLENLGTHYLVAVEAGDGLTIQATVPEGRQPAVGQEVWVRPEMRRALLYRKADGELIDGRRAPG